MLPGDIPRIHRGPRNAIEGEDRVLSYEALDDLANRFANHFLSLGLAPGDRVSLLMGNDPLLVAAYFGAFRARLVANPINNRLTPPEIAYILDHAQSGCVVAGEEYFPALQATLPLIAHRPAILAPGASILPGICGEGAAALAEASAAAPDLAPRGEDGALLIYTSGTTGKPKGVLLTQANVMAGTEYVRAGFAIDSAQRTLCVMPLFHTNGLMFSHMPFLLAGATVGLRKRFSASGFWGQLRDFRATSTSVSPTILAMLLEHEAGAPPAGEIRLDYIKVASAPTPAELAERFERRFGRGLLLETYGLTETTAINVMNPLHGPRKHGSIGRPLPPQEVRLVDREGAPSRPGEVGEIEVRGATVMKEYFRDPANTHKVMHDGWLRTGDLARVDDDGFVFIVGRSKEMILRGGENISPLEIEEVVAKHPAVREAAVVGIPDRIWGETVGLAVVPRERVSEEELLDFCRARMSAFKVPQRVVFVEALPRNAVGKVTRNALRDAFPAA
jgi:long-chain acyl-CoA synthetase